jgi:hypothetical protein
MKLAGPMGADHGVMPTGPEESHGTDLNQYAKKDQASPVTNAAGIAEQGNPSEWQGDMPDWLWNNFTTYDRGLAPGGADGSFGSENS